MERPIIVMAILRLLSGIAEIAGAVIFVRANRVSLALRVNSLIGLTGPLFFLAVGAVGVASLSTRLPLTRLLALCAGMGCDARRGYLAQV